VPLPDPADLKARMAERERRAAADTRTAAEQWLNDPEPGRSALARKSADDCGRTRQRATGLRAGLQRLTAQLVRKQ
jgi:hypothetical protein